MKISYFVPRCTPDNSHGRYVLELATRLAMQHSVTVYAGAFSRTIQPHVRRRFVPVPIRPAVARLATLWAGSLMATERRTADILHAQGADAPIANVVTAQFCNQTMRISSKRNAPWRHRFNYAIGAAAERYCLSKPSTRRIIAVSRSVRDDVVRDYRIHPDRVVVIHHGVDTETFHPRRQALDREGVRSRVGLKEEEFVVAFVGGDYKRKGLVQLLQAAARLGTPLRILAIGVRRDPVLQDVLDRTSLGSAVLFLDHTSEISPLYAAADCFVLPTEYDTFSLATLEAMASGLPIIVSRVAGVTEILTPNQDSLVLEDHDDVAGLAVLLGRLINDGALRKRLASEARRTAERHTWEEVSRQTLAVYEQLVS